MLKKEGKPVKKLSRKDKAKDSNQPKEKPVEKQEQPADVKKNAKANKKPRKPYPLKTVNIACVIALILCSFIVYCCSNDSKTPVLKCEGNYFYSDEQIYDMAHVSTETRLWLLPTTFIENSISKQDMIESVKVTKSKGSITLKIKEKLGIGYYIKDGTYYILTVDNESIELDEKYKENLIHLPLITGLKKGQKKQICEQLQSVKDDLDQQTIEKISQITSFSSSYDSNMIKLIMRDGNSVYSSMDSLGMIVKYQAVLTQLKGTNVCLVLDAESHAIDKIDCTALTTNRKEIEDQKTACEEDGNYWDDSTSTCTEKTVREKTDEDTDEEDLDEETEDQESEEITDWEYDETTGLYYSPSTGQYYTDETTDYYQDTQVYEDTYTTDEGYYDYVEG